MGERNTDKVSRSRHKIAKNNKRAHSKRAQRIGSSLADNGFLLRRKLVEQPDKSQKNSKEELDPVIVVAQTSY